MAAIHLIVLLFWEWRKGNPLRDSASPVLGARISDLCFRHMFALIRSTSSPPLINPLGTDMTELEKVICGIRRFVATKSAIRRTYFEATHPVESATFQSISAPFIVGLMSVYHRHRLRPLHSEIYGKMRKDSFLSSPSRHKKRRYALRSQVQR